MFKRFQSSRECILQEFNREQFKDMMKRELWRYSRRELSNVIDITGDDQFRSTIVM